MRRAAMLYRACFGVLWVALGGLAAPACLPDRLHDLSLQCDADGCRCAAGRGNCNGDWGDGCEVRVDRSGEHCGGCGQRCDNGTCQQGQCVCNADAGYADCNGDPRDGCETNVFSEALHCGGCGQRCAYGFACGAGSCQPRCPGRTLCDEQCFDLTRDAQHCGDCRHACLDAQACFDSICVACDALDCDGSPAMCRSGDLGEVASFDLVAPAATNGLVASCWTQDARGAAYSWRPPATGDYLIDTFGSQPTAPVAVRTLGDRQCSELACTAGFGGAVGEAVMVSLQEAEPILIEVVTPTGSQSVPRLHITPVYDAACAPTWLGWSLPVFEAGSFDGATDLLSAACAPPGPSQPEVAFRWVAPEDGYYLAQTDGSDADTVLYALEGGCGGPSLGCDDGGLGQGAQLTLELSAGEAVSWVVERRVGSPSGAFLLRIEGPL